MEAEELAANNAPLTINEQVIVMSGQETIRVLELEVAGPLPALGADGKGADAMASEGGVASPVLEPSRGGEGTPGPEGTPTQEGAGAATAAPVELPSPVVQAVTPMALTSGLLPPAQAALPITVQAGTQFLTPDSLAAVMTGMMTPGAAAAQPFLIPLSMAGQMAGQQSLAVFTFPTATMATLPGLTAVTPAGGVLKLPFTGLQAATVLNAVPPQLHAASPQTVLQSSIPAASPQKPAETQVSVATVQTAGISINPAVISAASLGAQPQFISSLATTPVFTSGIAGIPGITSQIITNAQGQVIGTLPFLLNPAASLGAGGGSPATLPAQSLQVQTISPQLLVNAQGQIIATIGGTTAQPTLLHSVAQTQPPAKPTVQGAAAVTAVSVSQAPVIIAPQPPSLKTMAAISAAETPTVGQLVSSKPQGPALDDDGINLEEIREFAKNFKIRRLSLGLTQTQVGQALTATEGPAYSQSAICRFEKLDITPKSAQKLKPVLERWLAEAELWNQKGQQNLMEFVGGEPSKKRKRRTSFTPQAIESLNTYFEKNALPTGQEITDIAKQLNYDREVVRVWFCNRRQTLKNTSKLNVFQI
ncbi:POU domain, class 6, transcription factor 1-like isoform X2 [Acipenser ruthenus]|uniref:POU domain, class 6, transcription factor 1-like isoform X2 n=1 Tax=Acipenser ruthenus TaxID=7906 RepID=UPI002740DDFC|nr:POU domain, class 6, transcription factor 1-like isoform X2 [Acipenser ruthenus]